MKNFLLLSSLLFRLKGKSCNFDSYSGHDFYRISYQQEISLVQAKKLYPFITLDDKWIADSTITCDICVFNALQHRVSVIIIQLRSIRLQILLKYTDLWLMHPGSDHSLHPQEASVNRTGSPSSTAPFPPPPVMSRNTQGTPPTWLLPDTTRMHPRKCS